MSSSVFSHARNVPVRRLTSVIKTGLIGATILALTTTSAVVAPTVAGASTATAGSAAAHPTATANSTAGANTGKIYFGVDGTVSQAATGR